MASSTSPEANEIRRRGRQRLIGAVAIAVALVVFVPMILDSEPRPARNEPVLEIPVKENAPPLPPPAPAKAAPAPSAEPKPAPAPSKAAAPVPPKAAAPVPPKAAAPAKSAPPPESAATPKLEGFAVQVGAFRDDEKLKQAREKLAAAGIAHYIERRDSAGGALTRLRAGPFATREAAEKALAALKAASLDGQVVPLP
jgi:DedD protein